MAKIGFYVVKMSSIFLMAILYFLIGSFLSVMLNDVIPDENIQELSTPFLVSLLCVLFGSISVVYYLLRIMIKRIPFFMEGLYGFHYELLREASGGIIVGYVMYAHLDKLKDLMQELAERFRRWRDSFMKNIQ
jgi:hypothetical protein